MFFLLYGSKGIGFFLAFLSSVIYVIFIIWLIIKLITNKNFGLGTAKGISWLLSLIHPREPKIETTFLLNIINDLNSGKISEAEAKLMLESVYQIPYEQALKISEIFDVYRIAKINKSFLSTIAKSIIKLRNEIRKGQYTYTNEKFQSLISQGINKYLSQYEFTYGIKYMIQITLTLSIIIVIPAFAFPFLIIIIGLANDNGTPGVIIGTLLALFLTLYSKVIFYINIDENYFSSKAYRCECGADISTDNFKCEKCGRVAPRTLLGFLGYIMHKQTIIAYIIIIYIIANILYFAFK